MKQFTFFVICVLLVSLTYPISATNSKTDKFESMFDLMKAFSSDPKAKSSAAGKKAVPKKTFKNISIANATKSDRFIFFKNEATLSIIKEGLAEISNPNLKNYNRYHRLSLPNQKKQHEIQTDKNGFRINNGFSKTVKSKKKGGKPVTKNTLFYFRLSQKNFYYSYSKNSINILEAIPLKRIKTVDAISDYKRRDSCMNVYDKSKLGWIVCFENAQIRNDWVCKFKEVLRQSDYTTCVKEVEGDTVPEVVNTILQPVILIPDASPQCNENFNYNSNGGDWECDCKEGREQSPIDLPKISKAINSPVKPVMEYFQVEVTHVKTTNEGAVKTHDHLKIVLENNAIRIKYENFGELVTIDGSVYKAQEIVFHTPSEHTIEGRRYDMEMQIIHFGQTRGDISKQAVVSFLFEKKPGVYNKFIDDIDFFNLPNQLNKERKLENSIYIPKVFYNSDNKDAEVMKEFSFYTYQGSLTAPPCSERTIMYVASKPIPISSTAIQLFQESLRMPDLRNSKGDVIISTSNPVNNRVTQPKNGRNVFHYEAPKDCAEKPKSDKPKTVGHYEKVDKEMTQYLFVDGPNPSGLPGALVVSQAEAKYGNILV